MLRTLHDGSSSHARLVAPRDGRRGVRGTRPGAPPPLGPATWHQAAGRGAFGPAAAVSRTARRRAARPGPPPRGTGHAFSRRGRPAGALPPRTATSGAQRPRPAPRWPGLDADATVRAPAAPQPRHRLAELARRRTPAPDPTGPAPQPPRQDHHRPGLAGAPGFPVPPGGSRSVRTGPGTARPTYPPRSRPPRRLTTGSRPWRSGFGTMTAANPGFGAVCRFGDPCRPECRGDRNRPTFGGRGRRRRDDGRPRSEPSRLAAPKIVITRTVDGRHRRVRKGQPAAVVPPPHLCGGGRGPGPCTGARPCQSPMWTRPSARQDRCLWRSGRC